MISEMISESIQPNLAASAAWFTASSTGVELQGPQAAVAGRAISGKLNFWEAASPPPGWWICRIPSPRVVRRFSFRVFDGVLDPSTFEVQAADTDDWITLFRTEGETGFRNEVKEFVVDNWRRFDTYRVFIEKTMGGPDTETAPFLMDVGLFEDASD